VAQNIPTRRRVFLCRVKALKGAGAAGGHDNINSGGFMEALGILNTGRDCLDERTFRVGLESIVRPSRR